MGSTLEALANTEQGAALMKKFGISSVGELATSKATVKVKPNSAAKPKEVDVPPVTDTSA